MKKLLPIPTIEHIPPYDRAEALCNKMDKVFSETQEEIVSLKNASDPFACKAIVLDTLGQMVSANVRKTDSENTKRHRIYSAIQNNKLFGTWTSVKDLIDSVCGGDARTLDQTPDDIWMLCGNVAVQNIAKNTWASLGLTQQSAQANTYGIALSDTTDIWQAGSVFGIDVDNNHLTPKEIAILYETLYSSTPVGMTINVGCMRNGSFESYFVLGGLQ